MFGMYTNQYKWSSSLLDNHKKRLGRRTQMLKPQNPMEMLHLAPMQLSLLFYSRDGRKMSCPREVGPKDRACRLRIKLGKARDEHNESA